MINDFDGFSALATECSGVPKKFEQGRYIALYADVEHGICRPLSAAFLIRNYRNAVTKCEVDFGKDVTALDTDLFIRKFSSTFDSTKGIDDLTETDRINFKIMQDVAEKYRTGRLMTEEEVLTAAIATMEELSGKMLTHKGTIAIFQKVTTEQLVHFKVSGFWLISTGRHMMAAVVRDKYKFFDPEYGQAIFQKVMDFGRFMDRYFTDKNFDELNLLRFG